MDKITQHPSPITFPTLFSTFDRDTLVSAVEVLVAVIDAMDGNPDEEDATDAEDDFSLSSVAQALASDGPGCTVSDSDCCDARDDKIAGSWDDRPGEADDAEVATAEWHTLPAAARRAGNIDGKPLDPWHRCLPEDAEEDDPSGQCDEDGINTDLCVLQQDYGPGCKISDPDYGIDDVPRDQDE